MILKEFQNLHTRLDKIDAKLESTNTRIELLEQNSGCCTIL